MFLLKTFIELSKLRLTLSVVFSSLTGFLIAPLKEGQIGFDFLFLFFGGFFVVASSNITNQIIEKKLDALMDRTKNRPLPQKRISEEKATILAVVVGGAGVFLLYCLNLKCAFFGALALVLYTAIYTPLKRITPLAVFVGAIPGAIPFMLGWVAATNDFSIEPGVLFAIQFMWQLPHFWAIAWLMDEDYKKAGFVLLPSGERDKRSSFQIVAYTFFLVLITTLPVFGITGSFVLSPYLAFIVFLLGLILLTRSLFLHKHQNLGQAKKLMFFGLLYLPLIQIIFIVNRFI